MDVDRDPLANIIHHENGMMNEILDPNEMSRQYSNSLDSELYYYYIIVVVVVVALIHMKE